MPNNIKRDGFTILMEDATRYLPHDPTGVEYQHFVYEGEPHFTTLRFSGTYAECWAFIDRIVHLRNMDALRALIAAGKFHHATYRDRGTLWEGLYIYEKDDGPSGFRGYRLHSGFHKGASADEAYELVRNTGVSFGAYGKG